LKGTLHRITILTCATIGALCGNIARQLNVHFGAFILRSTPSLKRVAKCGVPCDCRLTNLILIVIAQRRLICIHTIVALILIIGASVAYEHVIAIVRCATFSKWTRRRRRACCRPATSAHHRRGWRAGPCCLEIVK